MIGRLVPAGADRRGLLLLTFGHAGSDFCQGAVPALLPFMVAERGYSFTAIGALYLCSTIGSSLVQPLVGLYADRIHASWLMPAGLVAGAVGIAGAGLAPSFALTGAALVVSGLGVAAFHPEAARFAGHVSGARPGAGMSVFAVGGNAGFALGPVLVTPAVLAAGLAGVALAACLPLAAAAAIAARLAYLEGFRPARDAGEDGTAPAAGDRWPAFVTASLVATLRTGFVFGLLAFVPSYLVAEHGSGEAAANAAVTALLVAGAVGTLVGGHLADRVGLGPVIVVSLAACVPLALALPAAGMAGAVVLLVALGAIADANFYPLVLVAQRALPHRTGFASGVVLGLSIGLGAAAASALGVLADAHGLDAALYGCAGLAVAALAAGLPLPALMRDAAEPAAPGVESVVDT